MMPTSGVTRTNGLEVLLQARINLAYQASEIQNTTTVEKLMELAIIVVPLLVSFMVTRLAMACFTCW